MPDFKRVLYRGVWCAYWREGGRPRRYSLRTADEGIAEREFQRFLAEVNRPADTTAADLWSAYCHDRAGRRIVTTMGHEWKALGATFGALYPHQITVDLCRTYMAGRRANGIKDGTLWTELGHLRIVMNWAVKRGLIERCPPIERPMQPPPRDRYLTRKEAERLRDACGMPHVRLFVILMLQTAARPAAALELTWDRVDFERGQVRLNLFTGERRKGRATVPMTRTLRAALAEAKPGATCPWVVEYNGGKVGSIKKAFARACERAGLTGVSPHILRHSAAVWMAEAGVSMAEIANYLGHEDSRITERTYARWSPTGLRNAASSLEL